MNSIVEQRRGRRGAVGLCMTAAAAGLLLAGCAGGTVTAPPAAAPAPSASSAPAGEPGGTEEALQEAARSYIAAVNAGDQAGATGLTCTHENGGVLFDVAGGGDKAKYEVTAVTVEGPRSGRADVTVVGTGAEGTAPLPFSFDGQRWCVRL